MTDNSDTPTPVKATGRKVMGPAARRPEGEDATVDEYAASLERLSDRELDVLEQALRDARTHRARHPRPPSFGMSEGERAELEATGKTVSPWTGDQIKGDGAPRSA